METFDFWPKNAKAICVNAMLKYKVSILVLSADAKDWSLGAEFSNVLSYFTTGKGDQKLHVLKLT